MEIPKIDRYLINQVWETCSKGILIKYLGQQHFISKTLFIINIDCDCYLSVHQNINRFKPYNITFT